MQTYQTPQKEAYRTSFWRAVDECCEIRVPDRRVAILEDSFGLEAAHLLKSGYTPGNILAVNISVGKLAWMNRSLLHMGLPKIPMKAGEFIGMMLDGPIEFDVINYDSCSTICNKYWVLGLKALINARRTGILGLNVVAGRDEYTNDTARINRVMSLVERNNIVKIKYGKYVNPSGGGRTPMLWFCVKLTRG